MEELKREGSSLARAQRAASEWHEPSLWLGIMYPPPSRPGPRPRPTRAQGARVCKARCVAARAVAKGPTLSLLSQRGYFVLYKCARV